MSKEKQKAQQTDWPQIFNEIYLFKALVFEAIIHWICARKAKVKVVCGCKKVKCDHFGEELEHDHRIKREIEIVKG